MSDQPVRYVVEAEFAVPAANIEQLAKGAFAVEVGDEECWVSETGLGITLSMGLICKTFTTALRDAVCSMRGVIGALLEVAGALPYPVSVTITSTDAWLQAHERAFEPSEEA